MEQQNMMPNGVGQPNMNSMQRPQQGNLQQQLYAGIMQRLRQKINTLPAGWQTTYDLGQRANRIMQLISGLRILERDISKCIGVAEHFEDRTIHAAPSAELYAQRMNAKLQDILQKRKTAVEVMGNEGQLNQSMQNNMGNMNSMQNGGMGAAGMDFGMNPNMPNGMGMNMANAGMGGLQMGGNGDQQNQLFPTHLQRQMQPSALPQQQQQQQQNQPANNTMDPSALQMPQMQAQASNQMTLGQSNTLQGGQNRPGAQPSNADIQALARQMLTSIPEDRKNHLRQQYLSSMTEQQRMHFTAAGGDPIVKILMSKARELLIKKNLQQNGSGMQMGNNMQQTPSSQAGGPNFDFSSIMGQQANAIKLQESGEQVVPASNNNNGASNGNQMNMSQGVNPQMLGNQNNQGATNPQLQGQFNAMQQEKQRQERLQRQNQIARQQAMAQQNQLRGQPGGLNPSNALNGGQVNSPNVANNSMNMLNRPMVPPGQATPSTPQPNRPQDMSQTPANPASQLQQHHQNMLNQNNQQNQMDAAVQQRWLQTLPQAARDKLSNLPRAHVEEILRKLTAQTQAMNNGQSMPGLPAGMNGPQVGNQQQAMNAATQNMGNAGFAAQPNANQQQQQQPANNSMMLLQQSMAQHQQQAQQQQVRQKAMDLRPFPKVILDTLGMSVPEHVNEWGKLKMHIIQNQTVLPPNTLEKLNTAQHQWFSSHPEEGQLALQALRQRMNGPQGGLQQPQQPQQPQSTRPPSAAAIPNGQAPQAQMVPPTAPMQQPPNQNAANPAMTQAQAQARLQAMQGVSMDEVRLFREKMPQARNMTDDQIRAVVMRRKADTMNRGQAAQNAQAQMQQTMRNAQNPQRPQNPANGAQQMNMAQGNQQQGQQQAQRPQQSQQGARQQPNNQAQGQKRPQSNDDVVEIPNPNTSQAPQAPTMQANMSQGQQQGTMDLPTTEQLTKMSPQERMVAQQRFQQREALRQVQLGFGQNRAPAALQQTGRPPPAQTQAQQQAQKGQPGSQQPPLPAATQADNERMRAILQEVAQNTKKGRPVQLDSNGREQVQAILKKIWMPAMNLEKTLITAYKQAGFKEDRIKQALRAKLIVQQNARDSSGAERDYYSVTPDELRKVEEFIRSYLHDIQQWKMRSLAANGQGQTQAQNQDQTQAQAQTQAAAKPAPAQQQAPAKPAKPQQQQKAQPQAPPLNRKQSQQSHNRKMSASNKVPQAPTEDKKFEWGASSPQGVPKYEVLRNELTPANLKLPPKKKLKTDSQASTPAGQIGTPATSTSPKTFTGKAPSPETARKGPQQPQPKAAEAEKPKHKCDDPMCEASVNGFETAELLSQHKTTAHKPIEDPLKYLLQSAAGAFSLDLDGKPLPVPEEPKIAQPRGKPAAPALPVLKRDSRTPSIKQEVATPATPASGVKTAAAKSTSTPAAKTAADAKAANSVIETPAPQKTLMDTMAERIGFETPVSESDKQIIPAISAPTVNDNNDAWLEMFTHDLAGSQSLVDDWSQFQGVTDWGLRPADPIDSSPELTPSVSSRESDISETQRLRINLEWDAFGNGDTGIPEGLMETLGLGEDAAMADGQDQKQDGDGDKKVDEMWDWSADLTEWDAMFGPEAGLGDGNGIDWSNAGIVV